MSEVEMKVTNEDSTDGKDSSPTRGRRKKRDSIVNRLFSRSNSRAPSDLNDYDDGDQAGWRGGVGYGPGAPILSRDQQKSFREAEMKKFQSVHADNMKEERAAWKLKLMEIMDSNSVEIWGFLITLFALYGADINSAVGDKSSDMTMSWLNFAAMLYFFAELAIFSICKTGYFLSGYFWLDTLAAASLVGDVHFLANLLIPSGFAAARAGRAARSGTRAGRVVKLVRLTRLIRVVRLTRLKKYMKRKQRVSVVELRGTEEEKAILRKAKERDGANKPNGESEDDQSADGIANGISTVTIFKVIVIILCMLLCIPLLAFNNFQFDYRADGLVAVQTMAENGASKEAIQNSANVILNQEHTKGYVLWLKVNKTFHIVPKKTSEIDKMRENDIYFYYYSGATCDGAGCFYIPEDGKKEDGNHQALIWYSVEQYNRTDATNSCWTTTFIIALIMGSMYFFSKDAKVLAAKMTDPLIVLSEDMELVSNMSLGTTISHDPSRVREIRNIQETFLRMKYGLGSFAKYVPYEVVRTMMSRGEEAVLGVAPREITIFFSDIAGFTTICEKMKPNELLILLSDYFAAMSTLINSSGGTLLEFIGDAILAVWNAPLDVSDHAFQCVDQSIRMNAYLDKMQPVWQGKGYPPIKIRCGIHTATVFVGNIGSPDRMKYGVLGDGVNLASRLEELNKRYATKIMVSINTFNNKKVNEGFLIRPLDVVAVKGKSQGTAVFEVMGRNGEVDDFAIGIQKLHDDAFTCYKNMDWDGAISKFTEVAEKRNGDVAAELLKARCLEMKENPPPDNWDGVEVLKQKHF